MVPPLLALLPLLAAPALAFNTAMMRSRTVYQVVTDRFGLANNSTTQPCVTANAAYCGGGYQGIINRLAYIQGMGFDTIWISPIPSNIGGDTAEGEAYHGYWTLNPNELNTAFGQASDLQALSAALHQRGMYLMVDVVVNHVAATSSGNFQASSAYGPFSTMESFHPFCWITDYTNQTMVEQCWLGDSVVALPDLDTESQTVIDYWNNWITTMVSNFSVDAIRFDTVKNIRHSFWPGLVSASGVANVGEVLDGDPSYVGTYQQNASINPFNYPTYYPLVRAFNTTSGSLAELVEMVEQVRGNFTDTSLLGVFTNNHDNPRFESWVSDQGLIRNAHTYPFVTDGVPYMYYGSEQGFSGGADPLNREPLWPSGYKSDTAMYELFAHLNHARQAAGTTNAAFYTTQANHTLLSSNDLLISKPPLMTLLTNRGAASSSPTYTITQAQHGYAPSTILLDAVSCTNFTVDGSGNLEVAAVNGQPRVMIPYNTKGQTCGETFVDANTGSGSGSGKSAAEGRWMMGGWATYGVIGVLGGVVLLVEGLAL